jgi:hypothetical protein
MNTTTLKKLHKDLIQYREGIPNIVSTLKFIETMEEITSHQDVSSIPLLLQQFNDDPKYYWIFELVKCSIERAYGSDYVVNILANIHILIKNAPEWACNFLFDILRTPPALAKLKANIHPANPEAICKLLEAAETRLKKNRGLIQALRLRLYAETHKEVRHA